MDHLHVRMVARRASKSDRFSKTIMSISEGKFEKRQTVSGTDPCKVKEVMVE